MSAYINDAGITDGIKDKSVTYSYSGSGVEMAKLANGQTATPGTLASGQIPGQKPPTGVTAQPGNQSVNLSWSANEEPNIAGYKVYRAGAEQPASVTSTTYSVTGLDNDTAYRFRVTAVDKNGDESPGSAVVASIPQAVVDTTAPAAPQGLTASAGLGSVALSWAPNAESDTAGYRIYMDGTMLQTVASTVYEAQLTSLTPGRAYRFELSAYDRAGNESGKSDAVRAVPGVAPAPKLMITELVPDTDNHYSGYDAFEYVELYNNSENAIDLQGYTLKLESSDPTKSWQKTIDRPAVIGSHETLLLWTRKGELAAIGKDAFNHNFYSSYSEKYVPESSIVPIDDVSGLINTAKQTVVLQDADGNETVRASYNDTGTDVKTNTSIVFGYPVDGTNQMRKTAAKVDPTPGQLIGGQLAALPGSDIQPPAVPAGVKAAAGDGQVTLSWNPNAEADLAAYRVYKNGQQELQLPVTKHQAVVSLLTGNTGYAFTVSAVDVYGNESAPSAEVTAVPGHQLVTQQDRSEPSDPSLFPDFWNLSVPGAVVPGLMQDVVPQGMAYYEDKNWMLISNYRDDGRPSTLSVVDASTGQMVKSLNLYQENNAPYTGHAGGVAVSRENAWIASGSYLYRIPLETIVQAADQGQIQFADKLLTPTRASLAAYRNGVLWVGEYYEEPNYPTDDNHKLVNRDQETYGAWLAGYKLDEATDLARADQPSVNDALVPDYVLSIPGNIQGVDVMDDQIILTQSFTRAKGSNLLRYKQPIGLGLAPDTTVAMGQYNVPVWFLDSPNRIATNGALGLPPMAEGIFDRDGQLYILFESGANTYRTTALQPLDKVQQLNLNDWAAYNGLVIQGAEAPLIQGSQKQLSVLQSKGHEPAADVTAGTVFTSSNAAAATVDAHGLLSALAPGSTVITAAYGDAVVDAELTVTAKHRSDNGSSSTGGSGAATPAPDAEGTADTTEASADEQLIVDPASLADDQAAVTLPADKQTAVLPGAVLDRQQLTIARDGVTLTFSGQALQSIKAQLGGLAAALQDSKLHIGIKPVAADSRAELLKLVSSSSGAQLSAAGEWFDFSISLHSAAGAVTPVSVFDQPILVSFQVSAAADPALLGVYRIADDGSMEYAGGRLKDGVMQAELNHFSTYAVLEYNKSYADVPAEHWAAPAVQQLAAWHIVQGTSEELFSPARLITRAEFTALLARGLGLQAKSEPAGFSDVLPDAWYASSVAAAVEAGVIDGEEEGRFAPDRPVTREQMAAMLVRAHEYLGIKGEANDAEVSPFADESQISEWAKPYTRPAVQWRLMDGKESNRLDPLSFATRAESAQVIYNLLNKHHS
ncbi:fibronectin type III domain-containing protein [Paenibacillus sp. TAB 01]|uniref:fibronectin type III domain-containing protein n=1 Tax=Paenibacillus sp. TAB 01 TaxID=3368988 RepID=UPI0037528DF8